MTTLNDIHRGVNGGGDDDRRACAVAACRRGVLGEADSPARGVRSRFPAQLHPPPGLTTPDTADTPAADPVGLPVDDLAARLQELLGKTPDDPTLRALLEEVDCWPVPDFAQDEHTLYVECRPAGFCLVFDDAATVDGWADAGVPPQTAILVGAFFYTEGLEGYHQFSGAMPLGVSWRDGPESLTVRLGPPSGELRNPTTGALRSHRWSAGSAQVTVSYAATIRANRVYIGLS